MSKGKMMSVKVESEQNQSGESLDDGIAVLDSQGTTSRLVSRILDEDSKNISRQLVDLEILYLLNFGPKSGYQLKKSLYSSFHLNLSYGTLYPHLHSLDRAELISGTWRNQGDNAPLRKRMYSLTQKGVDKLSRKIGILSKIALTMQFMLTRLDLNPKLVLSKEESQKKENALDKVDDFLKNLGYSIRRNALLQGFSGLQHLVDLYASRQGEAGKPENLVLKIPNSESGVSMDDLFRVYVMSYDLQATRAIVLSAPSAKEEVKKLAKFYDVTVYSGKDLDEALNEMTSSLT